jgi:hypothetical protein
VEARNRSSQSAELPNDPHLTPNCCHGDPSLTPEGGGNMVLRKGKVEIWNSGLKACLAKHHAQYPVVRGDQATQMAWIAANKAWATFFFTYDGKILKKIIDSVNNGIEEAVFTKYEDYLLRKR